MEKLSGPAKPKVEGITPAVNASSSKPTPLPTSIQSDESNTRTKITVNPAPAPATTAENPFNMLTALPANVSATPVSSSSEATTLKRQYAEDEQSMTKAPFKKANAPPTEEDIESWENRVLGNIFRVTLDPDQTVDGAGHKLFFLRNLRLELEEEQQTMCLSIDKLDGAILEACQSVPHNKALLEYLLPCWKRVLKAIKGLRGHANVKEMILKEAKRLCMSHCIFAIEMPELYE
jgi:ubiquitin conjugation factor E4 B